MKEASTYHQLDGTKKRDLEINLDLEIENKSCVDYLWIFFISAAMRCSVKVGKIDARCRLKVKLPIMTLKDSEKSLLIINFDNFLLENPPSLVLTEELMYFKK